MKYFLCLAAPLILAGFSLRAADSTDKFTSSTWYAGTGPRTQIWILNVRGNSITGAVCGPCDDPRSMAPIVDGRVIDANHITFFIPSRSAGRLVRPIRAPPGMRYASPSQAIPRTSTPTLKAKPGHRIRSIRTGSCFRRSNAERSMKNLIWVVVASAALFAADVKPADLSGKWIADSGNGPAQVFVFEARGDAVDLRCDLLRAHCDAARVFVIEDGSVMGDRITFYIRQHEDRGEGICQIRSLPGCGYGNRRHKRNTR